MRAEPATSSGTSATAVTDQVGRARAEATAAQARRARHRRLVRKIINYVALVIGAIIVLFPIYITVVNSLIPSYQLAHQPPPLLPLHPMWGDYATAWSAPGSPLSSALVHSVIVTALITGGQIVTSVLAAYAFAFLRFPFRQFLFVTFLTTLMIPFEVTFITNFQTVTSWGWVNTYQGLAVPFLASGFGTFLIRQAFLQIPKDLQEAAILDGYGHWRFLARVAVPLARPAIAALAVFSFLGAWNQYLWPLVATGGSNPLYTVQIALGELLGNQADQVNVALAGAIIAVVPILVLLVFFQKQLVRGLTSGAVK